MRLIDTKTLELKEFMGSSPPRYAILSHTWEEDEVSFQEFTSLTRAELQKKKGFAKIDHTCRLARGSSISWAWIDTCCIDKTSSAELTEAINSMYRWYAKSFVCYAYLSDLTAPKTTDDNKNLDWSKRVAKYASCRWFTRGWTLQELIAPARLGFYNADWAFQGEKSSLSEELAEITKISKDVLQNKTPLTTVSVAQRMSWASSRQTTREEDMAYCLLGIFDVQIPLLYGEGGPKAFLRLQEEIVKELNDLSLFAWRWNNPDTTTRKQKYAGILATSPGDFADSGDIILTRDSMYNNECAVTSKGLRFTPVADGGLRLGGSSTDDVQNNTYVMYLHCRRRWSSEASVLGISLRQHGCDVYTRVQADSPLQERDHHKREKKKRVFYIIKTVSPEKSIDLGSSHRFGINLSGAIKAFSSIHFYPGSFEPAGHWDEQQQLFLVQDSAKFIGDAHFYLFGRLKSIPKQLRLELQCRLSPEKKGLEVKVDIVDDSNADVELQTRLTTRRRMGQNRMAGFLSVGTSLRAVDGQPVYFVEAELLMSETAIANIMRSFIASFEET
ncbi:HET-domain-containing protein [Podospora didyma]|uniref:HET-domain-containing protein n=1 Tax=Podospora didyma TaxID=330526 RepID=A0AAE0N9R5_9PEZI|nr:HET-domain-containing protein [Podospora didyma]